MTHFISIGPYCEAANILEAHRVRLRSFPFDYIFSSLPMIQHIIQDRCRIFLDKKYLTEKDNATYHSIYSEYIDTEILRRHHYANKVPEMARNMKNRPIFLHHNLVHEGTHQTFQRRCQRLLDVIDNKEKIVFVYYNCYTSEYNDLIEFATSFSSPNITILGIFENGGPKTILHDSSNCKIYQNYDRSTIFATFRS